MGGRERRRSPILPVISGGHRKAAVDDAGLSRFVASHKKRRSFAGRRPDHFANARECRESNGGPDRALRLEQPRFVLQRRLNGHG